MNAGQFGGIAARIERYVEMSGERIENGGPFHVGKFHANILMRNKITVRVSINILPFIEIRVCRGDLADDLFGKRIVDEIVAKDFHLCLNQAIYISLCISGKGTVFDQPVIAAFLRIERADKRHIMAVFPVVLFCHVKNHLFPALRIRGEGQIVNVSGVIGMEKLILRFVKQKDAVPIVFERI